MKQEKSAGSIIFYHDSKEKDYFFLILKYPHYWGFVKGGIDLGETEEQTAKREILEETKLNVNFIEGFKENQQWSYKSYETGNLIKKSCVYFLSKISKKESKFIKISEEHEDYKFVTLEESKKYIKINANQELLNKSYEFLKELNK